MNETRIEGGGEKVVWEVEQERQEVWVQMEEGGSSFSRRWEELKLPILRLDLRQEMLSVDLEKRHRLNLRFLVQLRRNLYPVLDLRLLYPQSSLLPSLALPSFDLVYPSRRYSVLILRELVLLPLPVVAINRSCLKVNSTNSKQRCSKRN